jgi:hypothetical protein
MVRDGPAKVLGGSPRRSRLSGMLLSRPQVRDRSSWHRQADSGMGRVCAVGRQVEGSKPLGDEPQPVARVRAPRDPAVRCTSSPVGGVRRSVQRRIPEHPGRNAQNVRRCPRGVRGSGWIAGGTAPDMRGRRPGLARSVLTHRVPLCSGDPVRSRRLCWGVPRIPSLAQLRQRVSRRRTRSLRRPGSDGLRARPSTR